MAMELNLRRESRLLLARWAAGSAWIALAVLAVLTVLTPLAAWAGGAGETGMAGVESRFFQSSDGVRLHYLEAGRGRTLVFIPGWTMPAEIWAPQIRHFSRKHRVVAFDPRSQGDSQIATKGHNPKRRSRDIAELLQRLGDGPVLLVGWSLGVLEVLAYVKFHDMSRVAGIVLVDSSVGENPPPKPTGFLARLRKDREAATREFVRKMYNTPQPESYYEHISLRSLKTPYRASLRLLTTLYGRDVWRKAVYSIRVPLLYAVTSKFQGQAGNLRRNKPEVQTEVFSSAGHALFVDEPERFNGLLERFMDREVWN